MLEDQVTQIVGGMLAAQVHRGPDDGGLAVHREGDAVIGLGNRRLAIIDLSPLGHQPMRNPDSGDVLVYNGEIYNAPEIGRELQGSGIQFRGHSDTEVLLRAYERWGVGVLDRLRGMFAFALWDARKKRLVLARDHLGIKPLYYGSWPGLGLIFASEVKAMLSSGRVPLTIDRRALAGYLAFGAVQEPLTIVEGIHSLPSASWAEIDLAGEVAAAGTYWEFPSPKSSPLPRSTERLVEEGRDLLERSVRRHLLSDTSLGVFLSSGLDSTAVLGLARNVGGADVHAFNVSFPESPEYDEGPMVRATALRLGAPLHECPVDASTSARWALEGLDQMDQPAMDGLNTYIVSRAVREQNLAVALSGQGGDEVFGGYRSFAGLPRWFNRMRALRMVPATVRSALIRRVASKEGAAFAAKAGDLAGVGADPLRLYFHYKRLLSQEDMLALGMSPDAAGVADTYQPDKVDSGRYLVQGDLVATVGRLETVFYLGNTLLRDGDVFGMANSLEIRVPFLDRDLVDWAFRLPGKTLLPEGVANKFLLRQMCADFYAPEQLGQIKRGFTLPFSSWLLGPLRQVMDDSLESLTSSRLITPSGVERARAAFLRQPHTAAWSRLWVLVALGHWLSVHRRTENPVTQPRMLEGVPA